MDSFDDREDSDRNTIRDSDTNFVNDEESDNEASDSDVLVNKRSRTIPLPLTSSDEEAWILENKSYSTTFITEFYFPWPTSITWYLNQKNKIKNFYIYFLVNIYVVMKYVTIKMFLLW